MYTERLNAIFESTESQKVWNSQWYVLINEETYEQVRVILNLYALKKPYYISRLNALAD